MRKNCPRVIHSRDVLTRQSGIIQCWSFGRSWLNGLRAFLIRFERGSHLAQITSAESVDDEPRLFVRRRASDSEHESCRTRKNRGGSAQSCRRHAPKPAAPTARADCRPPPSLRPERRAGRSYFQTNALAEFLCCRPAALACSQAYLWHEFGLRRPERWPAPGLPCCARNAGCALPVR